jgi:hypothetical protein
MDVGVPSLRNRSFSHIAETNALSAAKQYLQTMFWFVLFFGSVTAAYLSYVFPIGTMKFAN